MVRNVKFLTRMIALWAVLHSAACTAQPQPMTPEQFWRDSHAERYTPVSRQALATAEALFIRHLKGEWSESLAAAWQPLGFEAVAAGEGVVVIRERNGQRQGHGFFLFKPDSQSRVVLQMPHSSDDSHTGMIGFKLLHESDYLAAAWNTVTRDEADMAHLPDSYFTAFSAAFSQVVPAGRLVQLHGFAQEKRTTAAGRTAAVVLSSGGKQVTAGVRAIGNCLQSVWPGGVRLYPLNISELGGTRNTNLAVMQRWSHTGFVHLELSSEVRQALLTNGELRHHLNHCLTEGV